VFYNSGFARAGRCRKDDEFFQGMSKMTCSGKGRQFTLQTPNSNHEEQGLATIANGKLIFAKIANNEKNLWG